MPYRPSLGGLDYYKAGLTVVTGDGRWLKLDQTTPQIVSGGAPIFSSGLDISATGVRVSASNGILTLLGLGDGADENLLIDFNTTSNLVVFSSGTSAALKFNMSLTIADLLSTAWGSGGADAKARWETAGANDYFAIGTSVGSADGSGHISIMEIGDIGNANRVPLATTVNPTLRVYSADETSATDYIDIYHNQTNSVINSGTGTIDFLATHLTTTGTGTFGAGLTLNPTSITVPLKLINSSSDEAYISNFTSGGKPYLYFWSNQSDGVIGFQPSSNASHWFNLYDDANFTYLGFGPTDGKLIGGTGNGSHYQGRDIYLQGGDPLSSAYVGGNVYILGGVSTAGNGSVIITGPVNWTGITGNINIGSNNLTAGQGHFSGGLFLEDGNGMWFGTGTDARFFWSQSNALDSLILSLAVNTTEHSGYFIISDSSEAGNRYPLAATANATLRIYSGDGTSATDYIEFYHNQTNAVINSGTGTIDFLAANLTTTGNISVATINTAATQDLKLFDTGTVADDADGKVLQIVRKSATEGTQTLKIGTDQFRQSYLWTTASSIFASKGDGPYEHILWRNLNSEFQIQHQALGDITLFNSDGASIADGADGKTLWLFRKATEGTDYIRAYISAAQEGSISASGVLVVQSGGSGVLALRTASGSSILLGDTGCSDVGVGSPWMYEGDKNPVLNHYGYVATPAAIKKVSFSLSSDGVYYISREDTSIYHMQINMPLGLSFPNGTYGEFKLQKESVDSTHILYCFSHRSNNKDLWLYAYDGTSYKNFLQFLWDTSKVDFGSTTIGTTGYAILGTIRSDGWQSAGAEYLMQNFGGLEVLPGGLSGSDSVLFFDQIASGKSPNLKIYNYITAATAVRYAKFAVDDSDDYFHLSRQDSNILGFKIDMPISTASAFNTSSDINAGSTSVVYFGDSATDGTWKIVRDGNNLSFQRRESGAYVEKGKFQP